MNQKSRLPNPEPPTPLTRVTRLLQRAQGALPNAHGRSPTYAELQEWTGVPGGTIKYWLSNRGEPPAEFVLQLLERLPERHRSELLESAWRVYPNLDHPRLKTDRTTISRFKTMLRQPSGLVLIQGADDESRTFLLTALGHAFLNLTARPHRLAGLDAHEPDWFVPLPGVRYLDNLFQRAQLHQVVSEFWPQFQTGGAQLILLNTPGILLAADFSRRIRALTAQGPVVLAETAPLKPAILKRASHGPVQIVTVSKSPENGKGIAVGIESR